MAASLTDARLVELMERTLKIIEKVVNETELKNLDSDQEIQIISHMAPVLLAELIAGEKSAAP